MDKRGLLVVLSGPAGSGKSTLAEEIIEKSNGKVCRSITSTTRSPRPGEEDGVDYIFMSRDDFEKGIAAGKFLEHTEFNGNLYGCSKDNIASLLKLGKTVLLVIEVVGAAAVRDKMPESTHIFILPPTREILKERLCGRGTECQTDQQKRLNIAEEEIKHVSEYDFLVINDKLDLAVKQLEKILTVCQLHHIRGDEHALWSDAAYE